LGEGGECFFDILSGLSVDLAGREMGSVQKNFDLGRERIKLLGMGFCRRARLRAVHLLRIKGRSRRAEDETEQEQKSSSTRR